MEYLQYYQMQGYDPVMVIGFKPYYKWNTFNTKHVCRHRDCCDKSFKPYYKWNTFNTSRTRQRTIFRNSKSFKPYYKWNTFNT